MADCLLATRQNSYLYWSGRRDFNSGPPEPHSGQRPVSPLPNLLKLQHIFYPLILILSVHGMHAMNNSKYLACRRQKRLHIGYTKTLTPY